ncbi:hypothetical protein HAZT_HAZT006906 [Hyalella azteca]|uniref:Uncharacterized protein n=1 Tax=Hyalella azteca TaxID=294128 RepID=A0A6A0H1M4_HYAAZ|nr:hypothetical protein HAZT_HAZT006906 [Hyalella azteca]
MVYRGLDIITNKVTAGEQRAVKHHLLDFLDPLDDFYVHEFRDRALDIIQQLHKSGKLPVCDEFSQNQSDEAGVPIASHRYDGSSKAPDPNVSENKRNVSTPETVDISPESPTTTRSPGGLRSGARLPGPIRKRSHETEETDALYQRLVRVDPQRAEAIHPNDRRRIIRYISPLALLQS